MHQYGCGLNGNGSRNVAGGGNLSPSARAPTSSLGSAVPQSARPPDAAREPDPLEALPAARFSTRGRVDFLLDPMTTVRNP